MKTLEELLKTKVRSEDKDGKEIFVTPEFRVAVQQFNGRGIHFIIHPDGYNGDTLDLVVRGNNLYELGDVNADCRKCEYGEDWPNCPQSGCQDHMSEKDLLK